MQDRILLNKTDLVTAEELEAVKEELQSINAFAEVIQTVQSQVSLDRVLGVNSFSIEKTLEVDPHFLVDEEAEEECHDEHCNDPSHSHGHGHSHDHGCSVDGCTDASHDHGHGHGHDAKKPKTDAHGKKIVKKRHDLSGVSSVGITAEGELDFNKLNQFMMRLLQSNARDLYRSKGVMCFAGQGDAKFVFQGVHEQISFGPSSSTWQPGEARINKMVFIGRKLNRQELEAGFRACLKK
jgi:G3E family GTPase